MSLSAVSRPVRISLAATTAALVTVASLGVTGLTAGASAAAANATVPTATVPGATVPTATAASAALPHAAAPTNPGNPLAGRPWGVYQGVGEPSWGPYTQATGANRTLLGKIALRPKAKWFGAWMANSVVESKVRDYIAVSTRNDPDALVQLAVFRMTPWEHDACSRLPTTAEQASYKQWVNSFAAGIGSAHVALILQPDGPFALCAPGGSKLPSHLIGYSARVFSALPHTSVYIDAGVSDWPSGRPDIAANILMPAGIRYARGFALNSTHYASTGANITFGTHLVAELARRGVPGKHFVINTSSNGQPFTFSHARGPDPDNAKACATTSETVCVTLGIPPTTAVGSSRWRLSRHHRAWARENVDGYLWFGRPWLDRQASPFDLNRALALARTTPY